MASLVGWIRYGWFVCTGRGASNLNPAALEHYRRSLAEIDPLLRRGDTDGAKKSIYLRMIYNYQTCELMHYVTREFAWNPQLKDPRNLRKFLERVPHHPGAVHYAKQLESLRRKDR